MTEVTTTRPLPCNVDAERSLLAAMLHDSLALQEGLETIRPADNLAKKEQQMQRGRRSDTPVVTVFYEPAYQTLFDLILELDNQGKSVDVTTLIEEARTQQVMDRVGGASGIIEIARTAATGVHVSEYASIVLEKYGLRRMILSFSNLLDRAYEDREPPDLLANEAEQVLAAVTDAQNQKSFVRIGDRLDSVQNVLLEAMQKHGMVTGVPTHFPLLDEYTSGFQKTDLIILAARPSIGKTAFALNIARDVAKIDRLPVGIFSLEMSCDQIIQRLLSLEARVDLQRLRSGHLSKSERLRVFPVLANMAPLPIYVDDTPGLNIAAVRGRALRLKNRVPDLSLLIVDYLQLMEAAPVRSGQRTRQEEVATISRGLKGLARELEVPVMALSQLSRQSEQRTDGPRLQDLRESGAIEQDADVVLFLHRKKSTQEDLENDSTAEIIIGKQRNGPSDVSVKVAFIPNYAMFAPLSGRDAPDASIPPDWDSEDASAGDTPF